MLSSSTRASRSASRYSSPAQPNGGSLSKPLDLARGSLNDGSRSFMQRWLEPSVQNKPSFEEAGLARGGVVESMAPLGALPKVKKALGENGQPTRRIILKHSAMDSARKQAPPPPPPEVSDGHLDGGNVVEAMSPAVSPPASPLFPPAPMNTRRSLAGKGKDDEADDEEYDPKGDSSRRRSRRVTLPARRTTAAAGATTTATTTTPAAAAAAAGGKSSTRERRASTSVIFQKPMTPAKRQAAGEPGKQGFTDKVVAAAVDEALKHYRYPTAWALKTLYEEKSGDPDFVAMVQDVFSQTADEETMAEFFHQMEERKREGKKSNRGWHFFAPSASSSRFTPHKPVVAPYAHLIHEPEELPQESSRSRAAKKARISTSAATPTSYGQSTGAGKGKAKAKGRSKGTGGATDSNGGGGSTGKHDRSTTSIVIKVKTPASRKRARRDSGSSDSSLSTAISMSSPEVRVSSLNSPSAHRGASANSSRFSNLAGGGGRGQERQERQERQDRQDRQGRGRGQGDGHGDGREDGREDWRGGHGGPKSQTAPDTQPITTRRKSLASSKQGQAGVSNSSRSNSPTLHSTGRTSAHNSSSSFVNGASMPGRVSAADLFPNLNPKTADKSARAARDTATDASQKVVLAHMPDDDEDSFWDRRRTARTVTNSFSPQESSVRGPDAEPERDTTPGRKTRRTRQSLAASIATRATRSASKRPNDDAERTVSPVSFSLAGDGSSTVGSRAATPTSLRPAKRQKTGLRVKTSPVKKKGGTAAGVPRPPNEANSSSLNGFTPKDPSADNDEYCSACGNTGDVVCCDGCPRSFHFECVDMVQSENLPDEWYCNECLIRRYPSRVPVHKGIFGSALNNLEKSIPRAFSLPKRVQNRFEGVKAGADGDYEEVVTSKTARKRNGTVEEPDFFKQREDGQAVLCHSCQKPAAPTRSIIPCSVCSFYWHIDCLDPPLAVPPVLKTWRCPAHVDDVLIEVPSLAPAHRFRRVKGNQPITPALGRGLKNNGHIEIDWVDEPEESDESGWPDHRSFGRTYKLPAKGVILDFIEQLRNKGAGYGPRQDESKLVPYPTPPSQRDSNGPLRGSALDRRLEEMQVSLNLMGLRQHRPDGVDQLTTALLTAADDNMLSLMAQGNADSIASGQLTASDRLGLGALLAQMDAMSTRIRQVLAEDNSTPAPHPIKAEVSSPVTESTTGLNDPRADKMEYPALVTEPTPPSTVGHGEGTMDLD